MKQWISFINKNGKNKIPKNLNNLIPENKILGTSGYAF